MLRPRLKTIVITLFVLVMLLAYAIETGPAGISPVP